MNNRNQYQQGFRIYNDSSRTSSVSSKPNNSVNAQSSSQGDKQMEIALLQKLHAQTKIVGFLVYQNEIKGIRFYDPLKRKFIDIAPWQLNRFALSKLKLMGLRTIELVRYEGGKSEGTLLVEFISKHEAAGYFRANRMVSNDLAEALSGIVNYMSEEEYQALIKDFSDNNEN